MSTEQSYGPSQDQTQDPSAAFKWKRRDKYGFVMNDEFLVQEIQFGRKYGVALQERRQKWQFYLKSKKRNLKNINMSSKQFRGLVQGGIPLELRSLIWQHLVQADTRRLERPGLYNTLLNQHYAQVTPEMEQIEMDVRRTFPGHPVFDNDEGVSKLRRVLNAFALYSPQVGYCQSMNFVAAMLLLVMGEEEAFWVLDRIVNEKLPPDYYSENMFAIVVDQRVFQMLIDKRLPTVSKKFGEFSLPLSSLLSQWFLCLFMNALPTETALRVWDCFFLDGFPVLMSVGLAALKLNEQVIANCRDESDAFSKIRGLGHRIIDCDQLIHMIYNDKACQVPMRKIAKLRRFFEPQVMKEISMANRREKSPGESIKETRVFISLLQKKQMERQNEINHAIQNAMGNCMPGMGANFMVEKMNRDLLSDDSTLCYGEDSLLEELLEIESQVNLLEKLFANQIRTRHEYLCEQFHSWAKEISTLPGVHHLPQISSLTKSQPSSQSMSSLPSLPSLSFDPLAREMPPNFRTPFDHSIKREASLSLRSLSTVHHIQRSNPISTRLDASLDELLIHPNIQEKALPADSLTIPCTPLNSAWGGRRGEKEGVWPRVRKGWEEEDSFEEDDGWSIAEESRDWIDLGLPGPKPFRSGHAGGKGVIRVGGSGRTQPNAFDSVEKIQGEKEKGNIGEKSVNGRVSGGGEEKKTVGEDLGLERRKRGGSLDSFEDPSLSYQWILKNQRQQVRQPLSPTSLFQEFTEEGSLSQERKWKSYSGDAVKTLPSSSFDLFDSEVEKSTL